MSRWVDFSLGLMADGRWKMEDGTSGFLLIVVGMELISGLDGGRAANSRVIDRTTSMGRVGEMNEIHERWEMEGILIFE